jgi:hypothetical protein
MNRLQEGEMTRRTSVAVLSAMLLTASTAGVAAQGPESDAGPQPQRVEVPEAGIVVAFPSDWSVVVQMIRDEAEIPPELSEAGPVDRWIVLDAAAPDSSGCELVMYGDHPLGFDDHAAWIQTGYSEEADIVSVAATPVALSLGPAIRFDVATEGAGAWTSYLFESDDARYHLGCGSAEPPKDDWLSIAETIESIPMLRPEMPGPDDSALGTDVDYVLDFPTVVSVVPADAPDFPMAALMNADCAFAMWIPNEDGSAREWLACTLSDEPLQPSEQQGVAPSEVVAESGGECIWRSDYWYETDRSQVAASAYGLTITPDGQVLGWSTYPAEPLGCAGM